MRGIHYKRYERRLSHGQATRNTRTSATTGTSTWRASSNSEPGRCKPARKRHRTDLGSRDRARSRLMRAMFQVPEGGLRGRRPFRAKCRDFNRQPPYQSPLHKVTGGPPLPWDSSSGSCCPHETEARKICARREVVPRVTCPPLRVLTGWTRGRAFLFGKEHAAWRVWVLSAVYCRSTHAATEVALGPLGILADLSPSGSYAGT